ncbi:hypothetical protein AB6A40_007977 [Gnathostoma spinigerum]|uniref:Uncharacterized protein n=1 Tax=Gnathostoma spinigerum TaxID=75299 RepID=A0ABD6EW29_9BILA
MQRNDILLESQHQTDSEHHFAIFLRKSQSADQKVGKPSGISKAYVYFVPPKSSGLCEETPQPLPKTDESILFPYIVCAPDLTGPFGAILLIVSSTIGKVNM